MVGLVAMLTAACVAPPGNAPGGYDSVTEANHFKGCLISLGVAEEDVEAAIIPELDEDGELVDVTIEAEALPPNDYSQCLCVYEGIVETVPFADYEAIDSALKDPPAPDSTATSVPVERADAFGEYQGIWTDCGAP